MDSVFRLISGWQVGLLVITGPADYRPGLGSQSRHSLIAEGQVLAPIRRLKVTSNPSCYLFSAKTKFLLRRLLCSFHRKVRAGILPAWTGVSRKDHTSSVALAFGANQCPSYKRGWTRKEYFTLRQMETASPKWEQKISHRVYNLWESSGTCHCWSFLVGWG